MEPVLQVFIISLPRTPECSYTGWFIFQLIIEMRDGEIVIWLSRENDTTSPCKLRPTRGDRRVAKVVGGKRAGVDDYFTLFLWVRNSRSWRVKNVLAARAFPRQNDCFAWQRAAIRNGIFTARIGSLHYPFLWKSTCAQMVKVGKQG